MNGAQIAEKVRFGYAKAGSVLGVPHDLYRAGSPLVPALDPSNRLRTLPFVSAADPRLTWEVPSKHGNPYRYAPLDVRPPLGEPPSSGVLVGDYITGPSGTHLVLSRGDNEATMLAECNALVSVYRPVVHTQASEAVYGGRSTSSDTLIVASFPVAIFDGGRQQATRADLPGDVPTKGSVVLMPALSGVLLRVMDHLRDDLGRRYTVAACEVTALGWRLQTSLSEA